MDINLLGESFELAQDHATISENFIMPDELDGLESAQDQQIDIPEAVEEKPSLTAQEQKIINKLFYICSLGDIEGVVDLITLGADVNAVDAFGNTPLFYAAGSRSVELVRFLIEAGADVNVVNKMGQTSLFCAAEWGSVELVKVLAKAGADVNVVDRDGKTPLCLAALSGSVERVSFLIKAGADVNFVDKWSEVTPLYMAVRSDSVEVVRLLIEAGADANVKTTNNSLLCAAMRNNVEVARDLIEAGADFSILEPKSGHFPELSRALQDLVREYIARLVELAKSMEGFAIEGDEFISTYSAAEQKSLFEDVANLCEFNIVKVLGTRLMSKKIANAELVTGEKITLEEKSAIARESKIEAKDFVKQAKVQYKNLRLDNRTAMDRQQGGVIRNEKGTHLDLDASSEIKKYLTNKELFNARIAFATKNSLPVALNTAIEELTEDVDVSAPLVAVAGGGSTNLSEREIMRAARLAAFDVDRNDHRKASGDSAPSSGVEKG